MFSEAADGAQGGVEVAVEPPDAVVGLGACTVETDGCDADTSLTEGGQPGVGEVGCDRGRDGHVETAFPGMVDQLGDVGTHQTVPAGQDENRSWTAEFDDLVDEGETFLGAELIGKRLALR
jgi:hypothetical protein